MGKEAVGCKEQAESSKEEATPCKKEPVPCKEDTSPHKEEPATKPFKAEEEAFIHGRHTCDICLVTPIIGKRFHATNLPDYDLCEKCKNNYDGHEIKFEAVELDRDRPLQDRWRRRRARWTRQQKRGCQGRKPGRKPFGNSTKSHRAPHPPPPPPPPPHVPHAPPPPFHHAPPRPFQHAPPTFIRAPSDPFKHAFPSFVHAHTFQQNGDLDTALKEAIRRSLQDVTVDSVKQHEKNEEQPAKKVASENDVSLASLAVKSDSSNVTNKGIEETEMSAKKHADRSDDKTVEDKTSFDRKVKEMADANVARKVTDDSNFEEEEAFGGKSEGKAAVDVKVEDIKAEAKLEEKKTEAEVEEKNTEAKAVEKKSEAKVEEKKTEAKVEEKKIAAIGEEKKTTDANVENKKADEGEVEENKGAEAEIEDETCEAEVEIRRKTQTEAEVEVKKAVHATLDKKGDMGSNSSEYEGEVSFVNPNKEDNSGFVTREKVVAEKAEEKQVSKTLAKPPLRTTAQDSDETVVSFLSDAEGHGSIAVALGETLDKCANAINDVVNELERSSSVEGSEGDDTLDDYDGELSVLDEDSSVENVEGKKIEEPSVASSVSDVDVEGGATILDSVKSPVDAQKHEVESSDDSGWQIVNDINAETHDEDEAIALAAQLIGSSLFNSDMSRSGENFSALSGSAGSAVSMASSVPTNVASIASEACLQPEQRNRWVSQLKQLQELGFDEARCVEVLERLTAANIGVNSDEEVTVAQVVNELFK